MNAMKTMNTMPLLVRREFWEHRAFVLAPAIVGAIWVLIAMGFGIFGPFNADELRAVMQSHPDLEQKVRRLVKRMPVYKLSRLQVPSGHFYCLGDNLGASIDSRNFGTVPVQAILGRVQSLKQRAPGGSVGPRLASG